MKPVHSSSVLMVPTATPPGTAPAVLVPEACRSISQHSYRPFFFDTSAPSEPGAYHGKKGIHENLDMNMYVYIIYIYIYINTHISLGLDNQESTLHAPKNGC